MLHLNGDLLTNIKMKTKIFTALVLLVLVMGTVQASIVASIGNQGKLSFLKPGVDDIIKGVLCVSGPVGAITCVAQYIEGKIIGYLSGKIMQQINELSPEAYKAITTYNQVKSYIDKGSSVLEALTINEEGEIEEGSIDFGEEEYSIKEFFINLTVEDVVVSNANYDFETHKLDIKENGFLKINIENEEGEVEELVYENIKEGYFILGDGGLIEEAEIISSEDNSVYKFGNNEAITVSADTKIVYKNGVVEISGEDINFLYGDLNINLGSEFIDFYDGTITCFDCVVDDIELRGFDESSFGTLSIVDEGYLIEGGEAIYKQNKFSVERDNQKILIANFGEDLSDYDGNWFKQSSDVLEIQSAIRHAVDVEFLENHEILNTDSQDVLFVRIRSGDGLIIENREAEGLIPKVTHKSSEHGVTRIMNDKMEIRSNINGLFFNPPTALDLAGEDSEGKFQSVALEIESDSGFADMKLRINSYRQFIILTEDDGELLTYNQYDLSVSSRIEDNELQTIEQLREKYPNLEFSTPSLVLGLFENEMNEDNLPPYMLYLTDTFLQQNPIAVEDFEEIEFTNVFNAHVAEDTLMIGRRVVDFSEAEEFQIRSMTSPLQILKHEYEHRKDYIIYDEEYEEIRSNWQDLISFPLLREEELLNQELGNLIDERDEYERDSSEWAELNFMVWHKADQRDELTAKIEGIYYTFSSQKTLQQEYNKVVFDALDEITNSKSFADSFRELSNDLVEQTHSQVEEILERELNIDVLSYLEENGDYRTREEVIEDYEANKISLQLIIFNNLLSGKRYRDEEGNLIRLDPPDLDDETKNELSYLYDVVAHTSLSLRNLEAGNTESMIDSIQSVYFSMAFNPDFKSQRDSFDSLIRRTSGLPYQYALENYNSFTNIGSAAYREVSSTYREQPIETRRMLVQSGNNIIREVYAKLTQLAFDSGKMDVEEFVEIMGAGFCESSDCLDKLCVEYQLLCCIEHSNSPNC